ncbi:MAG: signal peptidase II [Candidatus Nanopelagicales bacterium]
MTEPVAIGKTSGALRFGRRWPMLLGAGLVVVVDQVSKNLALARGAVFFNPGIAFGLLADHPWLALAVAVTGLTAVVVLVLRTGPSPLTVLGLGMIIGGGLGNILDRVPTGRRPGVVDWISIPGYGPHFNLADVAIRSGVLLVIAGMASHLVVERRRRVTTPRT